MLLAFVCAAGLLLAQTGPDSSGPRDDSQLPPALVRSVKFVPPPEGPAVEIITTRPLVPKILTLRDPLRLVIDLPESYLSSRKRVDYRSAQVSAVRIDQFQKDPPIVRVVVDLSEPSAYTWDAAGNRLMVRLRPEWQNIVPNMPVTARDYPPDLVPIGGASASAVTTGAPGGHSTLTAGGDTAVLRLPRGGEVRVCPGTTVSVTYSQNGRDLLLGMNTGAIEAHYGLEQSADSVITPDFRILFPGPGEFHYAISADSRGNTCVRALPGNGASAIVSEMMGDGTYQVQRGEHILFRGGKLAAASADVPADCGCPAPTVPVLRTAAPAGPAAVSEGSADGTIANAGGIQVAMNGPETAPLPPSQRGQVHVQVDAPFVFRATDPALKPAPVSEVASLQMVYAVPPELPEVVVLPPPAAVQAAALKPNHGGFLGKIKGFFAAIFR